MRRVFSLAVALALAGCAAAPSVCPPPQIAPKPSIIPMGPVPRLSGESCGNLYQLTLSLYEFGGDCKRRLQTVIEK